MTKKHDKPDNFPLVVGIALNNINPEQKIYNVKANLIIQMFIIAMKASNASFQSSSASDPLIKLYGTCLRLGRNTKAISNHLDDTL